MYSTFPIIWCARPKANHVPCSSPFWNILHTRISTSVCFQKHSVAMIVFKILVWLLCNLTINGLKSWNCFPFIVTKTIFNMLGKKWVSSWCSVDTSLLAHWFSSYDPLPISISCDLWATGKLIYMSCITQALLPYSFPQGSANARCQRRAEDREMERSKYFFPPNPTPRFPCGTSLAENLVDSVFLYRHSSYWAVPPLRLQPLPLLP